ncbi:MAG TPA: transcriptional repressor LexA [Pyrinomonadaceae bacterium]|nr:transcriptional repressor LexA [Pyrinomonadaceae bacterium]
MANQQLTPREIEAFKFIRNSVVHGAGSPSIRDVQTELEYKSPRSAALIVETLIRTGWIERRVDGGWRILKDLEEEPNHGRTVEVPLVGTAACGTPLLAAENIEAMIPVSINLARPGHRYFFLRAKGDSMDQAEINDGDLVLVRQQQTAENGNIVVALIDDEATIKEFKRTPTAVVLTPRSSSKKHLPIILTNEFRVQGVVVTAISGLDDRVAN